MFFLIKIIIIGHHVSLSHDLEMMVLAILFLFEPLQIQGYQVVLVEFIAL